MHDAQGNPCNYLTTEAHEHFLERLPIAACAFGFCGIHVQARVGAFFTPASMALAARNVVTFQQHRGFAGGLKHMFGCASVYWTEGDPTGASWIITTGMLIGLLFHHKVSKHRVSMTVAMCLVAVIFAWSRNVVGFSTSMGLRFAQCGDDGIGRLCLAVSYLAGQSQIRCARRCSISGVRRVYAMGLL